MIPRICILILISALAAGCATMRKTDGSKPDGGAIGMVIKDSPGNATAAAPAQPGASLNQPYVLHEDIAGKTLAHNRFDYPVQARPEVEKWIHYFTGKGRKYFSKYLERGRYFIPEIAKVLKDNKMPQDLVYLAMIESGFNNVARSHAKAVGPWQFMKFTGQRYGLRVDYWMDERRDTRKATMAAIAYLRELYQEFGSWEMAAAGYNAGEGKVRRGMKRYRTNDFWLVAKKRFFKRETRDYVPKIMAAAIITKNPELFAFEDPFKRGAKPTVNPTTLMVADETGNLKEVGNEEPTPKELATEVAKSDDTSDDPSDDKEEIALSKSASGDDDESDDDSVGDHATVVSANMPALTPSVYMVQNPDEQIVAFELKGPADLFAVAKAAGLPYSTIKVLNPELVRWCTPPDMKTFPLKLPSSVKDRFLATYNDDNFDRRVVFQSYAVKRGDNLQSVSRKFKIDQAPIREINSMGKNANYLTSGSTILLPIPTGYKRVIASIYDDPTMESKRKGGRRRKAKHRRVSGSYRIETVRTYSGVKKFRVRPKINVED